MQTTNHQLFLWLNAGAEVSPWLLNLAMFTAKQVIYGIPLLLVFLWLWGTHEKRCTALKALAVTGVALAINYLLGIVIPTPRPFEIGLGYTYLDHAATPAFPSNHFTIFLCIAITFIRGRLLNLGLILLIVSLPVAWARIFVGVHYPIDMMGAIIVAIVSFICVSPLWRAIGAQITRLVELAYGTIFAYFIALGWVKK